MKNSTWNNIAPPFKDIPMLPNAHPIFGHIQQETRSLIVSEMPSQSIKLLYKYSNKGMSSMWIANDAMLLVFDPKAARTLLKTYTFRKFPKLIQKHFDAQTSGGNNIIMMNDNLYFMYN